MTAVNQDMILHAGDDAIIEILVTKLNNEPVNSFSISAIYSLSRNSRSTPLVIKSSDDNQIIITETTYKEDSTDETLLLTIKVDSSDTIDFRSGYYYHEAEITDTNNGQKYTIMSGKVEVKSTII